MSVLGVVLAGGESRRFGSDKALAELGGATLLERAVATLQTQCSDVVIAGRGTGPARCVRDWPESGLGPLGGLAGALRHAAQFGQDVILTCGVDSLGLPDDLLAQLTPAPAYVASQPVIGLWTVDTLPTLETILTGDGRRSMLAFAEAIGARPVRLARKPANINSPEDLAKAETGNGL